MDEQERIEILARQLRAAAFPGANSWACCAADVRERWLAAGRTAAAYAERNVDQAYRRAIARSHAIGQHEAAKAIRALRDSDDGTGASPPPQPEAER